MFMSVHKGGGGCKNCPKSCSRSLWTPPMTIGSFWICYFHNIKYGPTHVIFLDMTYGKNYMIWPEKLNYPYLYSKGNSKGETTSNNTSCNHFIESFLVLKIPQRPTTIKTLACPTTFLHTRKIISVMYL